MGWFELSSLVMPKSYVTAFAFVPKGEVWTLGLRVVFVPNINVLILGPRLHQLQSRI